MRLSRWISGIMICMLTSGCLYYPQSTDIPLISHKNDLKLDAGFSLVPATQATVSLGLTDQIAVQAYLNNGVDYSSYTQGAVGYYKKIKNNFIMESYLGIGVGSIPMVNDFSESRSGDYTLYFLQLNYGKENVSKGHIDFGYAIKTGYMHSNLVQVKIHENYDNVIFEPAIMFRIGGKRLKFCMKIEACYLFQLGMPDDVKVYSPVTGGYFPLNASAGIHYSF